MSKALYSFDVFDTVMTRTVTDPHAIFLLVGHAAVKQARITCSAVDFKKARILAEVEARRLKPHGEVLLPEIYERLGAILHLEPAIIQVLAKMELSAEREALQVVKPMREKVSKARESASRVFFLSDMYLPSDFIREKLREFGLFQNDDVLWVSGELGENKSSGRMFAQLIKREGVRPSEICHCGDHRKSDVEVPRRLGIQAHRFDGAQPNRYEQILERHSEITGGASSILAGASRLVRLNHEEEHSAQAALRSVAAGVAAPSLLGFVMWLLMSARQRGLRKLYFLARDGQILLKIARLCAPFAGYEGELHYLFASRQSWRLPGLHPDKASLNAWAQEAAESGSLSAALEQLGLRTEEIRALWSRHGFAHEGWANIPEAEIAQSLKALAADVEFIEKVAQAAQLARERFVAYLQQSGVLDAESFGIVDLGWHGSLQLALEQVLTNSGNAPPVGFYFGLAPRAKKVAPERSLAYFFDERLGEGILERNYWVEPLMEVFCTADHGMTQRFEPRGDVMAPVLKSPKNERALAWGLSAVQSAIIEFTEIALSNMKAELEPGSLRMAIHELLGQFWNSPSREEAEAWGSYAYSDDQSESIHREWAAPFGLFDSLRSIYRGKMTPPHKAGWGPGGLLRSPGITRVLLPCVVNASGWIRQQLSRRSPSVGLGGADSLAQ